MGNNGGKDPGTDETEKIVAIIIMPNGSSMEKIVYVRPTMTIRDLKNDLGVLFNISPDRMKLMKEGDSRELEDYLRLNQFRRPTGPRGAVVYLQQK